ncbi:DUF1800 domain-containing protein [Baekduia soli]|uniref:DUF1800 domain-containing protein n=1 Tax=Baekduia soli TaxID=496014 RepID=A0A5B8U210_9ACTN|nr:DUF1800 domain-containing protein [Baekduia soli]QEC47089.1 DUF1800 domain-containing protein [Baekduia soli]
MGGFTEAHARRVLWRAGFGGSPSQVRACVRDGRAATLARLLEPDGRRASLHGPAPMKLDPVNVYGHDVLWWLDRMVRTTRPLEEKMVLFWHDHFATRDQDTPLMLRQNAMFRRHALGGFGALLADVLVDPAMGGFLNIIGSDKGEPNENFARELMELFTLGEGEGYTETDVREAARALTGYVEGDTVGGVLTSVRFDRDRHDTGVKRIFGHSGRLGPQDVLRLCVAHRAHAPLIVRKLWSFFVDEPLDRATRLRLQRLYVGSGHKVKPLVGAILAHPALYAHLEAPTMVKAPVVAVAGMLRASGTPVATEDWTWVLAGMGQQLFSPPSVAGWDWGPAWMSSNAMRMRIVAANVLLQSPGLEVADKSTPVDLSPTEQLERAQAALGHPWASRRMREGLLSLARGYRAMAGQDWQRQVAADMTQRAMRHLLLSAPDAQLH